MEERHSGPQCFQDVSRVIEPPRVVVLQMRHAKMTNYTYIVIDPITDEAVIVDPAWEMDKVDLAITESHAKLKGVLITHSHPDHVNLAEATARTYDCPIWMSGEAIASSNFRSSRLIPIDTKSWTVGSMLIEPIFTPGHSPGCMCYLVANSIFTGDTLFAEGCGMVPDVESAYRMFISLQNLKLRIKPQTRIYPGHSYGQPPGQMMIRLLKDNIYLQFTDKESFTAYRLRGGQDIAKMFNFC